MNFLCFVEMVFKYLGYQNGSVVHNAQCGKSINLQNVADKTTEIERMVYRGLAV